VKQNIKSILLAFALACSVILTGCGLIFEYPPRRTYEFAQPEDQIKTIEVVYMDPFCDGPGDEIKVIYTVTEIVDSDPQKFLEGLSEVTCYGPYRSSNPNIKNNVIRIVYQDGSFELMSAAGVYYIHTNGRANFRTYSFEETEFRKFMNKSVDESFENKQRHENNTIVQ